MEFCMICGHPISDNNTSGIGCECSAACKAAEHSQPISDNNTSGIGCECSAALQAAKRKLFFANNENSLKYNWIIKASILKEVFIKMYEGVNFRSEFRKSFFESISKSSRISKKQLDVITDMISERTTTERFNDIFKKIEDEKEAFFYNECEKYEITREAIEIARREIRAKRAK